MLETVKLILCSIPVVGGIFCGYQDQLDYINKAPTELALDQKSIGFKPFFKTSPSDPDYMPLPPELTEFDRGILKVCGEWGAYPDKKDFRMLLNYQQHQKVVEEIYDRLDHQVITPDADLELFKDELTKIWFADVNKKWKNRNRTGFRHIFCGEPSYKKLGGMHFVGRYVEAQENQWAGAIWDKSSCSQLDIKPPVYTLGVRYLDENKEVRTKCPSGYDYNLHADDIIVFATQAFKELGKAGGCLHEAKQNNYISLLFRTRDGITTFYPDLTPKCDNKSISCSCSNPQQKWIKK